ncbi:uncharacterized protein VSU04_013973 [Chlamydotis macqueenii]
MPAANMTETLQLPALQVPEQQVVEGGRAWSSSSTPTLRRKRFKMRRMKNVQEQSLEAIRYQDSPSSSKEYLQLPSIEITPSSDEDTPWSNCSTPSASPRRKRFLLRKWLRVREKKEYSESSLSNDMKNFGFRRKVSQRECVNNLQIEFGPEYVVGMLMTALALAAVEVDADVFICEMNVDFLNEKFNDGWVSMKRSKVHLVMFSKTEHFKISEKQLVKIKVVDENIK